MHGGGDFLRPYIGIEGLRAGGRFDAEFALQGAAAHLVLVQRFVAASGQGQCPHAAPVRLLEPGLALQLQPRGRGCLLIVANPSKYAFCVSSVSIASRW